ncbi:MAG TPA: hypothetical protein ENH23_08170 [candidate division Zixibacteria bacterium]|nr:hypothetical protein [candidate division Zixibacteria bacterium]
MNTPSNTIINTISNETAAAKKLYYFGLYSTGFALVIILLSIMNIAPKDIAVPEIKIVLPSSIVFLISIFSTPVFGWIGLYFMYQASRTMKYAVNDHYYTVEELQKEVSYLVKPLRSVRYILYACGVINAALITFLLSSNAIPIHWMSDWSLWITIPIVVFIHYPYMLFF